MVHRIYLDNNASTYLDARVIDYIGTLLPKLGGNPSSIHTEGRGVRVLITKARDTIAGFLKVKPSELVFTSGGTEGVNLAIRGLATKGHIITSLAEHSCVIGACKQLEASGCTVTYLSTGVNGAVSPEAVIAALRPDTSLIALMAVNNETGVKTDIHAVAKVAEEKGVPFFVDAVAQFGKERVEIPKGVTAMAFSGHKIHALQGSGLLFVRSGTKLKPLLYGGQHEHGRRAGTENVIGILSLGKAVELLAQESDGLYEDLRKKRKYFETTLLNQLKDVVVNGAGNRVSNTSNLAFGGVDGETFLMLLDKAGIAASHGSACSSGALEPSRVLLSMGLPTDRVKSSLRFSFSRHTSQTDIERACETIVQIIHHMRAT